MRESVLLLFLIISLFCLFSGCTSNLERPPNEKEINYFKEISLGSEYGDAGSLIIKWPEQIVRIKIFGIPDEKAMNCLNSVIKDFNDISETTKLELSCDEIGDIDIHFIPYSEFSKIEPKYVSGNMGFFTWDNTRDCRIYHGRILIDNQTIDSTFRCHLIREELTQSLGLGNDAKKESPYKDSIFFGEGGRSTTYYSDIDKKLIQMMYSKNLPFCANSEEVDNYFGGQNNM
jgi:hypothetical protein